MLTTKGEMDESILEKKIVENPRTTASLNGMPIPIMSVWTEYYHEGELVRRDIEHRPMTNDELLHHINQARGKLTS